MKKNYFQKNVYTEVPRTPSTAAPTLIWMRCKEASGGIIPDPCPERCKDNPGESLDVFEKAITNAGYRVWIIDRHFDYWGGFHTIRNALEKTAAQIRILTSEWSDIHDKLQYSDDNLKDKLTSKKLELRNLHKGTIHDRIALVDDQLWHWGATVGGGHNHMNAVSYGWPSKEAFRLTKTFQELWEKGRLDSRQPKRRKKR